MEDFLLYMLSNMSLKEKIGQMIYIDYRKPNIKTTEMTAEFEEILSTFNPGGFILFTSNISNLDNTYKLINDIQSVSEIRLRVGCPIVIVDKVTKYLTANKGKYWFS